MVYCRTFRSQYASQKGMDEQNPSGQDLYFSGQIGGAVDVTYKTRNRTYRSLSEGHLF